MKRIIVVGGGMTGLGAAHALEELRVLGAPLEYRLIEGSGRFGGNILTEQIGDFLVEGGADCFVTEKFWAIELARRVGIESSLIGTNEAQRITYIFSGGRLHPIPEFFPDSARQASKSVLRTFAPHRPQFLLWLTYIQKDEAS